MATQHHIIYYVVYTFMYILQDIYKHIQFSIEIMNGILPYGKLYSHSQDVCISNAITNHQLIYLVIR